MEDKFVSHLVTFMRGALCIRARDIHRSSSQLAIGKATSPDIIGPTNFRELASVLAGPLAVLFRSMFIEAVWPRKLQVHHMTPLHISGSVYASGNYCEVNLTGAMSKIAERVIGNPLISYLQQFGFGTNHCVFLERQQCA